MLTRNLKKLTRNLKMYVDSQPEDVQPLHDSGGEQHISISTYQFHPVPGEPEHARLSGDVGARFVTAQVKRCKLTLSGPRIDDTQGHQSARREAKLSQLNAAGNYTQRTLSLGLLTYVFNIHAPSRIFLCVQYMMVAYAYDQASRYCATARALFALFLPRLLSSRTGGSRGRRWASTRAHTAHVGVVRMRSTAPSTRLLISRTDGAAAESAANLDIFIYLNHWS
eukprot:scaffold23044_cov39-Tisochrysis_lutea.AAC.3